MHCWQGIGPSKFIAERASPEVEYAVHLTIYSSIPSLTGRPVTLNILRPKDEESSFIHIDNAKQSTFYQSTTEVIVYVH